jgi:hypothetical protein
MAQELFTLANLGTTAGATAATVVVGNTVQSVLNYNPRWLALAIAQIVVIAVTVFTGNALLSDYFLAILNGCLVYCSAVGINTITSPRPAEGQAAPRSARDPSGATIESPATKRLFVSRWW